MKYLFACILLLLVNQSFAQETVDKSLIRISKPVAFSDMDISKNLGVSELTEGSKLFAINTGGSFFYRSYLVDKEGKTVSDGFMPRSYFMPNANFIVITAQSNMVKDSFNPYGAYDMPSLLILGTFNNFISRFSKNKR